MADEITLCMIVGNETTVIERCLNSFEGAFDELVMVKATGAVEADDTLDKAMAWCQKRGLNCRFHEYKNRPENSEWPHVDNFGAARQVTLDMVQTPWWMWCDADDVLEKGGAVKIRQLPLLPYDVFYWHYLVDALQTPPRERLLRTGIAGSWKNAIHEHISGLDDKARKLDIGDIHYRHESTQDRDAIQRKRERNQRILTQLLGEPWLWHFYVAEDNFRMRNFSPEMAEKHAVECVKHSRLALAYEELHEMFRFQIFLNLAQVCTDGREMKDWCLSAFKLMPWRREPLVMLACIAMLEGKGMEAWGWATSFVAKPEPPADVRSFNHWKAYYGWLGSRVYSRSLRMMGMEYAAKGQKEQAVAIEKDALKIEIESIRRHGGKITVAHATRGRAWVAQAYERWMWSAANPGGIEHIFAVDSDDKVALAATAGFRRVIVEPGGGCVRAWNEAAKIAMGDVIVQASDDWQPPQGWDAEILGRLGDTTQPKVLAVSDGLRSVPVEGGKVRMVDDLLCMAIVTKARIAQQDGGLLFWPEYKSVFSDNEFTVRAYSDGVVIEARDLLFKHLHPLAQGITDVSKWDSTYQASNSQARYEEGMKIFMERNRGHVEKHQAQQAAKKAVA